MKWLTFDDGDAIRHGYVDGDEIAVMGEGDLSEVVRGRAAASATSRTPLDRVRILPPLLTPGKILAVAANHQSHVVEAGSPERKRSLATPRLFMKPVTALAGTGSPVLLNPITHELDWEVELAAWIGREARDVDAADALDYVFGYSTGNDISARSLDLGPERDGEAWTTFFDWLAGKWLDGSAAIGPYLVTRDEVPDPQALRLTLTVNGRVRQDGSTADVVHTVAELVAFASRITTLKPGDVILTGTPAGVGATTGEYLNPGDVMVAEVHGLGALTTPVGDWPADPDAPSTR